MSNAKSKKPTTPEEEEALINEFRQLLTPGGSTLVDEQLKRGGEPNGLDILTLRRWLVARKWDLVPAVRDLSAHALYRSEQVPEGRVPQVRYVLIRPCNALSPVQRCGSSDQLPCSDTLARSLQRSDSATCVFYVKGNMYSNSRSHLAKIFAGDSEVGLSKRLLAERLLRQSCFISEHRLFPSH